MGKCSFWLDFVLNGHTLEDADQFPSSIEGKELKAGTWRLYCNYERQLNSDIIGTLSNWVIENSKNVCLRNGISCRQHIRRVVANAIIFFNYRVGRYTFLDLDNLSLFAF